MRFVQVVSGPPARTMPLGTMTFTVSNRGELVQACRDHLARLKRAHEDATRAIDIDGKTLAEVEA